MTAPSSRTANALMMWGSNVASAQRSSTLSKGDENRFGFERRALRDAVASPKQSTEEMCGRVAQQLLDEANEYQYCEQILEDNEKEFRSRERELLAALEEISRQVDAHDERPPADEVRLREEALWHLESTLRRLEQEEDIQGQAIVAIAECISSCHVSSERASSLINEAASVTCRRILENIRYLREVCVAFNSQSQIPPSIDDDSCEIEISSRISRLSSDTPVRHVLTEAFQRLLKRCKRLREHAAERMDALGKGTSSLRELCDRQSVAVNDSHEAIDDLRSQSEEIVREIESCSQTETLLKAELKRRSGKQSALRQSCEALVTESESKGTSRDLLEVEHSALLEEKRQLQHVLEQESARKGDLSSENQKLARVLQEKSLAALKIGTESADHEVMREVTRKTHAIELEIESLQARSRRVSEDENSTVLGVQTLHSRLLGVRSELSDIREHQKRLSQELLSLQKAVGDRSSQLDATRLELDGERKIWQQTTETLASVERDFETEKETGARLGETVGHLKERLLQCQNRPHVKSASSGGHRTAKRMPTEPSNNVPIVASKLENAVTTAPLSQLLLSDSKAPLRVPLEPRHRQFGRSDVVRDNLVHAFQL